MKKIMIGKKYMINSKSVEIGNLVLKQGEEILIVSLTNGAVTFERCDTGVEYTTPYAAIAFIL